MEELIKALEEESKSAIGWFKMNDMIVNPDKIQTMIISCIEIYNQLNFEKHVSTIIPFYIFLSTVYIFVDWSETCNLIK